MAWPWGCGQIQGSGPGVPASNPTPSSRPSDLWAPDPCRWPATPPSPTPHTTARALPLPLRVGRSVGTDPQTFQGFSSSTFSTFRILEVLDLWLILRPSFLKIKGAHMALGIREPTELLGLCDLGCVY